MNTLNALESAAIATLILGEEEAQFLQAQLELAIIRSREATGVGFFTEIDTPQSLSTPSKKSYQLSNAVADIKGLKNGAGFVLYVENGLMRCLEGFAYDEVWPAQVEEFSVRKHRL
ncbi:MAG: hypothetical protein HS115_12195 [Spirochaetales bacterium]|nr:hypothetical protein [Spirochaetales bacterium]